MFDPAPFGVRLAVLPLWIGRLVLIGLAPLPWGVFL